MQSDTLQQVNLHAKTSPNVEMKRQTATRAAQTQPCGRASYALPTLLHYPQAAAPSHQLCNSVTSIAWLLSRHSSAQQ